MKLKTLLAVVALMIVCQTAMAAKPTTPRERLIERLQKLQKKGVMFGHQDDPFYGLDWEYEDGRSDTYDLVGDYPAVMGFDLGGIEVGDAKNLDSVPFELIRQEIIRQHMRGGIITVSWHPRNPLNGATAWCEKDIKLYKQALEYFNHIGKTPTDDVMPNPQHTVKAVLPGGLRHEMFMSWLKRVADFLGSLKDDKGNQVPVIFRPWHEYNGSWFWWGKDNCSSEEYLALWYMTQDYLNAELPGQLVWSNSPNLDGMHTMDNFLKRWPGDDRVDVLGEDAYQWGTEEMFKLGVEADMKFLSAYAEGHGLILAFTECGIQNSPNPTWWSHVFLPFAEKYHVSYILPWRNYKGEHFGVGPKICTAADFMQIVKAKRLLFLNDIKKVK